MIYVGVWHVASKSCSGPSHSPSASGVLQLTQKDIVYDVNDFKPPSKSVSWMDAIERRPPLSTMTPSSSSFERTRSRKALFLEVILWNPKVFSTWVISDSLRKLRASFNILRKAKIISSWGMCFSSLIVLGSFGSGRLIVNLKLGFSNQRKPFFTLSPEENDSFLQIYLTFPFIPLHTLWSCNFDVDWTLDIYRLFNRLEVKILQIVFEQVIVSCEWTCKHICPVQCCQGFSWVNLCECFPVPISLSTLLGACWAVMYEAYQAPSISSRIRWISFTSSWSHVPRSCVAFSLVSRGLLALGEDL